MPNDQDAGALQPVGYMRRTRDYYRALGYRNDYQWAKLRPIPFTPLKKPLSECRATVITTASPPGGPPDGNPRLKTVWSGPMSGAPADLHTELLAWDKEATHTRDRESYIPLLALSAAVENGRVGSLSEHFHGVPTTYSQRQTIEQDAPEIVRRCQADGADIAILSAL